MVRKARAASVEPLLDIAAAHYAAGRLDAAAHAYRQAETTAPRDMRATYSLAIIDIRRGALESALARLKRVVRHQPGLAAAQHNLGYVSQRLGYWAEAADAYRRVADLDPAAVEPRFNLGAALTVLGRTDEAVSVYRSLAADPTVRSRALTRAALIAPSAIDDAELATLRSAADDPRADIEVRIGLSFALGEVLDARRDFDAAYAAYAAGNALKHAAMADPSAAARANAAAVAFVERQFTRAFIDHHQGGGLVDVAPIFIVGMPRSGSTLIEQILASHPSAQGMGESSAMADTLASGFPYIGSQPPGPGHFEGLARRYLDLQRARGWDGRSRLIDKTLENYLYVGMIQLMFPRAVVLHSVRGAMDTGFACFRQLFVAGNETLYDLDQIGAEYRRVQQVMDHWSTVLPARVVDVDHEALVTHPDDRIRWLVTQACGLGWDPACLSFHQSARPVTTASAGQVRQPIFTSSLQRWRNYERHLGVLKTALGPYAPDAG